MITAEGAPDFVKGISVLGRWCTIGLGLSIPASVAADNLLLAVVLGAWLAGLRYRNKLALAWHNPVYRAALLLFGLLILGTLYSDAPWGDIRSFLSKYADLALIAILGWSFAAASDRGRGLRLLAAAFIATLLMSYALKAGLTPEKFWLHGTPDFPIVFKSRLTHNILMAFAAYLFVWLAMTASSAATKFAWGGLTILAIVNVTLMVEGATGYVLLAVLALLLSWQQARWKGMAIALVATAVAVTLLTAIPGPFKNRISQISTELVREGTGVPATTSAGYRMEFYRNTLQLVGQSPLFGSGTGSFPSAYAALVAGTGQQPSHNPHNEFLLIAVQTGALGLAAFLWLLWQQWRLAPQLPTVLERSLAQGTVVTIVVVSMFNSTLLDHTEGLFYAWMTALLYAGLPAKPLPQTA